MSSSTDSVDEADLDVSPHPPADSPGGIDLSFRPDVEGLRAVAVTVVVLYHAGVGWFRGGFIGVDVFFVISGFLITGLLIKEHDQRKSISIVGFYARRARRILPAGMLVIVLTVFCSYNMQNFIDYSFTAQAGRWAALFAANWHFILIGTNYTTYLQPKSPLLHYWSLAVEEQFYLVWPMVVIFVGLVFRKFQIRNFVLPVAIVASGLSLFWSIHQTAHNPTVAFFSPFTRAYELGVGAVLACLVPYSSRIPRIVASGLAWAGLAIIAYTCAAFHDAPNGLGVTVPAFPGSAALVPVLATAAVILGGSALATRTRRLDGWLAVAGLAAVSVALMMSAGPSHRFSGLSWALLVAGAITLGVGIRAPSTALLGVRPVRAVGRVSYGWYLLHYPLMILLVGAIWTHPLSVEENLVIAAGTLVAAFAMYRFIERPIRRSVSLARYPWASVAMGAAMVVATFLFCWLLHPNPVPPPWTT